MARVSDVVGLLHRAGWTRLNLAAGVSEHRHRPRSELGEHAGGHAAVAAPENARPGGTPVPALNRRIYARQTPRASRALVQQQFARVGQQLRPRQLGTGQDPLPLTIPSTITIHRMRDRRRCQQQGRRE